MARQATATRSAGAQKWQVARPAENGQQADAPSEDEHGGSTRIPSSGGASPSASSTELGQQRGGPGASNRLGAQDGFDETPTSKTQEAQKEKDDRARWADVESDGEEVIVFEGEHKNAGMDAGKVEDDGWATVPGKKPKNAKPKPRTGGKAGVSTAPTAATAPAQRATAQAEAASIAAASSKAKAEEERQSTVYRPPRPDTRQSPAAHAKDDYDNHGWDASSWGGGSSGRGGSSWASSKNSGWESGGWSQKHEASRSHGGFHGGSSKGGFSKGRGGGETRGKEKSESFKRGPSVTTNMDASRLSW